MGWKPLRRVASVAVGGRAARRRVHVRRRRRGRRRVHHGSTAASAPTPTGPAPGVTDDTIKVGVTFVDTASLVASGLNYDLGDHEAVYRALFDAINADGGIHGRQIEPVFAPINPTKPAPAEAKCLELTEDEDVFVVTGFFLADAVNCPVATHATAVVGGEMNPERLEGAEAPWITWTPDDDQPKAVLQALDDRGELDGTVGVWAAARDEATTDDVVLPMLEELGVEVAESGDRRRRGRRPGGPAERAGHHRPALRRGRCRHGRARGRERSGVADHHE